jgi:hemerythrin-like domain-containing protein
MELEAAGRPKGRQSWKELLEEHREAKRLVRALEETLDRPSDEREEWAVDVAAAVEALLANLRPHFKSEETGCLYREVPVDVPHLADRCCALASEHDELMRGFEAAIESTRDLASGGGGAPRAIEGRLRRLIATLRRHEAEENEILIAAYWDDLGAGD